MEDNEAIKILEAEDYEWDEYMENGKVGKAILVAVEALKQRAMMCDTLREKGYCGVYQEERCTLMEDNEAIKILEAEDYEWDEYMENGKAGEAILVAIEALKQRAMMCDTLRNAAKAAIKELCLAAYDAQGNVRPLQDVLFDLNSK